MAIDPNSSLPNQPKLDQTNQAQGVEKVESKKHSNEDVGKVIALCFFLLLEALGTRQEGLKQTAEKLGLNADSQNKLNETILNLEYPELPPNATDEERTNVENTIQMISTMKQALGGKVSVQQQKGKSMSTDASSETNTVQMDAEMSSKFLNTLSEIVSQILQKK